MWVPSTTPRSMGNPAFSLNATLVVSAACPAGNTTNCCRWLLMASINAHSALQTAPEKINLLNTVATGKM